MATGERGRTRRTDPSIVAAGPGAAAIVAAPEETKGLPRRPAMETAGELGGGWSCSSYVSLVHEAPVVG